MAAEQFLCGTIGKIAARNQRIDLALGFYLAQQQRGLKGARRRIEHFRQLQLSRVQIETAQLVGQHRLRQYPDHQLMLDPQPLGYRAIKITGA